MHEPAMIFEQRLVQGVNLPCLVGMRRNTRKFRFMVVAKPSSTILSFTRHKHALLSDSAEIFVCFTQQATVSKSQRRGTICIFLLFDRFTGETTEKR